MRLGPAEVRFTGRAEGDLRGSGPAGPRAAADERPWTLLRQVHGARVVVVERPGGAAGAEADAAVTAHPGAAIAILTADCAPVALAGTGPTGGVAGAAHAGWRGLVAGVLERTADAVRRLGATSVVAALGPCVGPECYGFGAADLDAVARRLGDGVRARTAAGSPALDLRAGVRAALASAGVEVVHDEGVCTACSPAYFSHRAGADPERQAMIVGLAAP